jgi:GT2 family glycosyltransferase
MSPQTPSPIVSVVIPTFRRWSSLQLTLDAMAQQTLDLERFEVIVSDDGSEDGTVEKLKTYADGSPLQLVVTSGANAGPSAARNRGLRLAKGTWVAFTDDDCVPAKDWLEQCLNCLEADPTLDGVGGKVLRYKDGRIARYVDWTEVLLPAMNKGKVHYLVTSNAVFRNALLQRLGGFNETYKWPGGEDPDLSFRVISAGGRLKYHPDALVLHMHRESVKGTYRMFWHHGLGAGIHAKLEGKEIRSTLERNLREQMKRNMKRAFEEQSFMDAAVFSYLEFIRRKAFLKGFDHHTEASRSGATSSN